jgi:hypothetical protein
MRTVVKVAVVLGEDLEAKNAILKSIYERKRNRDRAKVLVQVYKEA